MTNYWFLEVGMLVPSCHSSLDECSMCCPSFYRHLSVTYVHTHAHCILRMVTVLQVQRDNSIWLNKYQVISVTLYFHSTILHLFNILLTTLILQNIWCPSACISSGFVLKLAVLCNTTYCRKQDCWGFLPSERPLSHSVDLSGAGRCGTTSSV